MNILKRIRDLRAGRAHPDYGHGLLVHDADDELVEGTRAFLEPMRTLFTYQRRLAERPERTEFW